MKTRGETTNVAPKEQAKPRISQAKELLLDATLESVANSDHQRGQPFIILSEFSYADDSIRKTSTFAIMGDKSCISKVNFQVSGQRKSYFWLSLSFFIL